MANVFSVLPVSDKIVSKDGTAAAIFTVTNTTSRPVRGIAQIKPLGSTESSWLEIEGVKDRDFPAGGTHQFTVNFNKSKPPNPPKESQPAEIFQFRLDVFSNANPGDFAESPVITVEIPEQKVVKPKPFPWLLVLAGAALLLIVSGVVIWLVTRNTDVEVPDVTTKVVADAEKTLTDLGFTVKKVEVTAPGKESDKVISQEPVAGDKVAAGSEVELTIPALIEVPDVTTKAFIDAEKELKDKGLKVEKEEGIAPDKEINKVFAQDPPGGSKVAAESVVKVTLPAVTTVPPLKGICLIEAIDALAKRDLKIGTVSGNRDEISTCAIKVGTFDPPVNAPIAKGASVNLNFPCIPSLGKLCFKFPWDKVVADPAFKISSGLKDTMKRADP